jgi:hypothetical protein
MTNANNTYHGLHDNNSETGMFFQLIFFCFLIETIVDISLLLLLSIYTRKGTSNKNNYK